MTPIEILQRVQGEIDIAGYKYTAILEEDFDGPFVLRVEIEISLDPDVVVSERVPKKVSIGMINIRRKFYETYRIIDYGGNNWVCDYPKADPCTQDWNLDEVIQILMNELAWLAAGNKYDDRG